MDRDFLCVDSVLSLDPSSSVESCQYCGDLCPSGGET